MKLFVAVAVFLLATVGSAADLDKCAWGESYWCSDLRAAKTCGAIKHCTNTIWKNQKLAEDSSEVCEFCEAIFDDVIRFVTDNRTETDIAKFLMSACGVIPDDSLAATCKLLVQEFVPDIIQMLTEEVTPQVVCSLLKMCQGLEDKVMHKDVSSHQVLTYVPLKKTVGDDQYCTDCKKFFTDFKEMLTSKTEQEVIEQFLENDVCVWFGFMAKKCKEMVQAFLPLYLEYISQFDDPNMICHLIRFCTEAQHPFDDSKMKIMALLSKAQNEGADECQTCKAIVGELQALVRNPDIQKEIESFLKDDVCSWFGTSKEDCIMFVDAFAPKGISIIAAWLDPDARCRGFGFCSSPPILSLSSANDIHQDEPNVLSSNSLPRADECTMCQEIIKEVQSLLAKNTTEEKIIEWLNKACSIMPGPFNDSCYHFVKTYVPAVINMLRQEVDPKLICTILGVCSGPQVTTQVKSDDTCLICETVVQYIEAMVEDKTSVDEIEKLLKKVCNFLPDTMKTECTNIVDEYGQMIAHLIATEYTPKQVCQMVKLCSDGHDKPAVVGNSKCTQGPAYWCASPMNAQKCGAVEHCKMFVWKN